MNCDCRTKFDSFFSENPSLFTICCLLSHSVCSYSFQICMRSLKTDLFCSFAYLYILLWKTTGVLWALSCIRAEGTILWGAGPCFCVLFPWLLTLTIPACVLQSFIYAPGCFKCKDAPVWNTTYYYHFNLSYVHKWQICVFVSISHKLKIVYPRDFWVFLTENPSIKWNSCVSQIVPFYIF